MKSIIVRLGLASAVTACSTAYNPMDDYEQLSPSTMLEPPAARSAAAASPEDVARGRYLVGLLGCGTCHTNGALIGEPNMAQLMAGSDTGIAWSNPLVERNPGVVYPANLTPDVETGIGSWSAEDIVRMIRTGVDKHSGQTLPVMPWPGYANMEPADATAIAYYLLSLPPVVHQVPINVRPGQRARAPFVHFGIYRSKQ